MKDNNSENNDKLLKLKGELSFYLVQLTEVYQEQSQIGKLSLIRLEDHELIDLKFSEEYH